MGGAQRPASGGYLQVQGKRHPAAAHPICRPGGEVLWHAARSGGAYREAVRDRRALRHLQALCVSQAACVRH